jgi:hypothetical protein
MFRVVAVALVLFAFTASFVPAYAAPRGGDKAALKADSDWLQAAIAWMSEVIYGEAPGTKSPKTKAPKAIPTNGPCIDPWGRCT